MKLFIVAAVLCVAVSEYANAQTTAGGPGTGSTGGGSTGSGGSIDPAVENAICADTKLSSVCSAKGEADATCKEAVTKVNGIFPKCHDQGVCSFSLSGAGGAPAGGAPAGGAPAGGAPAGGAPAGGSPSGSTTPSGPATTVAGSAPAKGTTGGAAAPVGGAPAGGAAGGKTYYISSKEKVDGGQLVKQCSNGVHIFSAAH